MKGVRDSWWDGPWPWLAYLIFYPLPWLWRGPSTWQLAVSLAALAVFLPTYILAYRLAGRRLVVASLLLLALGVALAPVGGGWTVVTVYAGAVAARLKPYRAAVALVGFVALATLATALLLGQPPLYWAAGVLLIVMTGGAGVSREMFFDRTETLLASQEEVRRLAGMAERERIGRDLHDVVGRALTLAALKADLAVRLVERDPASAVAEMRDAGEAARAGLAEVRAALAGQAGGGLAHEVAASERALAAAGVRLEVSGDPDALPPGAGAILAMTLREAVTNVVRHADATCCAVAIEQLGDGARLTVTDDGTGGPITEGCGLTGMRQRLVAAGGSLALDGRWRGLRLVAEVPE